MWLYVGGFYVALPLIVLAGYRYGGKVEREVATLFAIATALSLMMRFLDLGSLFYVESYDLGGVIIDCGLLVALILTAVRTPIWWILCIAALQMTTLTAHVLKATAIPFSWLAYALMNGAASYPALLLLAIGIAQYRLSNKQTR